MDFDFEPAKSVANGDKHGIDFIQAQALWDDPGRIGVPARTVDEARWLLIGRIGDKHWSAVITYRGDTTRIISVRRSRQEEVGLYES
ncbi:BrnT family toxin [Actinopolymorpha singaporensis]